MQILIVLLSVVAHILIGVVTLKKNRTSYTNRFFFAFTVISSFWAITNYLSLHQLTEIATLHAIRWVMFFAVCYTLLLFLTIHTFPYPEIKLNKYYLRASLTAAGVVGLLTQTPLIFKSVDGVGEAAKLSIGPAIPFFALTTGTFIISALYLLFIRYKRMNGIRKSQIEFLIIGVIGSTLAIFISNFVLVVLFSNTSLLFMGPTFTLVFIVSTSYSIIAHHMFDIRVIIKRTIVYSILLAFVLTSYALVVFIFSQLLGGDVVFGLQTFVPNIIAAVLIAFGFDPLRRLLQEMTDKYLFKGEYDPQNVANNLAKALSNAVNLDESLDSMMSVLTAEMRIGRVATLIVRTIDKDTVVKRVKSVGFSNVVKLEDYPTGTLLQFFGKNARILLTEEAKEDIAQVRKADPMLTKVIAQLEQFQAAVALPLFVNKVLIGIMLVGAKLSGDSFSRQDLEVLELIGNQTALSIEKTRFYEEDKLKSEFISIASHELLTPTAAIEGYLSMALDAKMPQTKEQHQQYVQRAYDSSRRLADLVKDLLSISRIESGRMKLVPAPMDIVAIVQQACDELQVTAKGKGLELLFTKPEKQMPKVIGDSDRMMQVCINLINNSIKYTPKGSITVRIEAEKDGVRTSVTDTGIGIAKVDQAHLFEKFHRIDNAATAGIMGTGLGLYIVKNIITMLGGKVEVQSEEGKGSVFSFTLLVAK